MLETLCSIPLRADIFAQAVHPSLPLLAVGLSSGRVETYRLPSAESTSQPQPATNHINKKSALSSKLRHNNARRGSQDGFGMVETVWTTKRHKGSCRSLCMSGNGEWLFSAGTDGIVKAAEVQTGRVVGKIAVPADGITTDLDEPSLIHALTPQTFLLGTDSGLLHLYDLRLPPSFTTSTTSSSPFPNPRPSSTFRPHHPKDSTAPPETEPLTSLTALPPTTASTSQTSRAFVTTAAATLAVTDIRKGIVALSEDQGDLLLSSTCVSGLALSKAAKRRAAGADAGGSDEKIVVGGAGGVLTLWNRGEWGDQGSRIKIAGSGTSGAFDAIASGTQGFASQADDDDCTVDSLCAIPDHVSGLERVARAGKLVVAGLGNGGVRVVRLRGGGGEVVGTVRHDEGGVEGVVTLGWESEGRMVSGGGNVVKVWGVVGENEEQEEEEEEEEVRAVGGVNSASNGMTGDDDDDDEVDEDDEEPVVVMGDVDESDEDDSDDDSSDDDRHKRKKRNKGKKGSKGGNHGISGSFRGMD